MNKIEALKLVREANTPKLLFKCKNYIIEKIPSNYRITIKCAKRNKNQGIERDWYSGEDYGLDEAHKVATEAITAFFRAGFSPVNPFNTK